MIDLNSSIFFFFRLNTLFKTLWKSLVFRVFYICFFSKSESFKARKSNPVISVSPVQEIDIKKNPKNNQAKTKQVK